MSKTIKLEDLVYDELTTMLKPKETYSQCEARLLTFVRTMGELRDVLEGVIAFQRGQTERIEKLTPRED
jgi:predicted CopG family antitoxin